MLRSFEHIRSPGVESRIICEDEEKAAVIGGGQSYATPWHWHDCLMIMIPRHGTVEIRNEGQREGTWLTHDRMALVPAGLAHSTRAGLGSNDHMVLYVMQSALIRLARDMGDLRDFHLRVTRPLQVCRSPALRALQDLALRDDFDTAARPAIRRNLTVALLAQCVADVIANEPLSTASRAEHGMALVADIKAYLKDHADREIPLDALAAHFAISRRHITRLFREGTGQSIGEYQSRMRLDHARQMLQESNLPIGEVAFRAGFDSGAALARAMRRTFDLSPSEMRTATARTIKS